MFEVFRGSGRTTRMLDEARRLADEGKAVYVIAANEAQRRQLQSVAGENVKVETHTTAGNFDWEQMRLIGSYPNCVTLVDHYAIESRFAKVLEMLHRFDPPTIRVG